MTAAAYAEALYSLAVDEGISDKIYDQLEDIIKIYNGNSSFIRFLDSPCISFLEKNDLLNKCFQDNINPYLLNCLKIMCEKKVSKYVTEMSNEYMKLYRHDNKIENAVIITAMPINEQLLNKLHSKLEEITKKTIIMQIVIDPDCIGGIIINLETSQIDDSIKSKIQNLRKHLLNACSIS